MIICQICGKECRNNGVFANHLKVHYNEISAKDYYNKFLKNDFDGQCIVCNKPTDFLGVTRGYRSTCGDSTCVKKSYGSMNKELYAKRYSISIYKAKKKISEKKKTRKGNVYSPFDFRHWMKKGYEEKEARYKANSIRPIRKEYWIEKGYSEFESAIKAKNTKKGNNKKGALASSKRDVSTIRLSSPRCIEYWINEGYTNEEAKEKVSEIQRTFSLEKCIEKYGQEAGLKRWLERQEKWQNTLKSKSPEEIKDINEKKLKGVWNNKNNSLISNHLFQNVSQNLTEEEKEKISFAG